ncbi:membrane protein [Bacteroidales bacterium]|nr:membrane protein [Bacteroidales bacterium]
MTIEPTASFWDCGEFIASAYKLEVGHPPGNPIFMLTANLFTQLASEPSQVAMMVNCMSAILSALTILFLFWTITHLTKKLVWDDKKDMTLGQLVTIMGSGMVGALVYTFSDTFWFSAVEAEVYAYSSLMTALVFWLILKWEDVADQPHANKWLVLIAYLMGISIAVHLLNLLCIPAIVLVYYFKKYPKPTLKGAIMALLLSFVLVGVILYGIIQGLVEVCGWFELFFVNVLGMPYNSGVIIYIVSVFAIMAWGIWESMQDNPNALRVKISFVLSVVLLGIPFIGSGYLLGILIIAGMILFLYFYKKINVVTLNTILISLFVITIGYSSYALIMIRSAANPPMDQNAPKDIFTLRDYLTREQYGNTPLFYGETYVSEIDRDDADCGPILVEKGPVWSRAIKQDPSEKDAYFVSNTKSRPVMVDELNMIFPRMYSTNKDHIASYKSWASIKGRTVRYNICGRTQTAVKPTFGENIRFFFNYQVNFMYWRYFMWNFSGRQNDIQGHGEINNGNWITGFKFIDKFLVGPQEDLPINITQNKGNNKYYMLPLLLGILGILFQAYSGKKGAQGFWVTFILFFMTGLAIVIYLNQTPYQPRERDYAYAGSFYAFTIWIGIGVAGLAALFQRILKVPQLPAAIAASALCLIIPIQMCGQNWDDHDRSDRFVARDFGFNYLTTCEPNAVIFTNGDNDTFPLWYAQEVEGYRTDVRVCNLSYLQTDWYIDQMKLQSYESSPLPISWKKSDYIQGTRDAAYINNKNDKPFDLEKALDYARSDDKRKKQLSGYSGELDIIPSQKLYLPIDKDLVMASGLVKQGLDSIIPEAIIFDFSEKTYIGKHEMIILNMLANNKDWKRPFYYATTVNSDQFLGISRHFRQDGIAYRIMPFDTHATNQNVDTDIMFDNMMNKYKWGGIENPKVYMDENSSRMARSFRMMFSSLINALISEGKIEKAEQVADYSQKVIPSTAVIYDYSSMSIVRAYISANKNDKALLACDKIAENVIGNLRWYNRLDDKQFASLRDLQNDLYLAQELLSIYQSLNPALAEQYAKEFSTTVTRYQKMAQKGGANQ